jgi:hypothetical protein
MYSAILNPPLFDMTFALLAFLPFTAEDTTQPNDDPNPNIPHHNPNPPTQPGPHPYVQDSQIQTLFTTSCTLLRHCASTSQIPLIRTVMRGVLALAWKVGVALPGEAEHTLLEGLGYLGVGVGFGCYQRQEQKQEERGEGGTSDNKGGGGGCGGGEGVEEVPVDFDMVVVLPWEVGRRVLGEEGEGGGGDGGDGVVRVDLAGVVAEWAAVKMGMGMGMGGGR